MLDGRKQPIGLQTSSPWLAPGFKHPLQHAEHEEQRADHDTRPPRAQGAVEHDEGLDDAQREHAKQRAGHIAHRH